MIAARRIIEQPLGVVAMAVLAVAALAALRYLDQNVAQAGLWVFLGLTFSTGFFHGALDIILLQREFAGARRLTAAVAVYAGTALIIAMICAHSGWLLILVLLLMSVWHFGEPYGRWEQGIWNRRAWVQRVVAGGAPVMLPALLSPAALRAVMPAAVALDAALALLIWQVMAWLWVGVCGFGLVAFRRRLFSRPLLAEVVLVLSFNLLLSPLMAFSIYFGVLHAGPHILRVAARYRRAPMMAPVSGSGVERLQPRRSAVAVTCLATMFLLLVLIWTLQGTRASAGEYHSLLNGVIVALTALTLPHLILVSRNAAWLTTQSPV